jgi:hypothetical protein
LGEGYPQYEEAYNQYADKVDRRNLESRVDAFLVKILPQYENDQQQRQAYNAYKLQFITNSKLELTQDHRSNLVLNQFDLYQEHLQLQESLANRRYQKGIVEELKRLLVVVNRERNAYRELVLLVSN